LPISPADLTVLFPAPLCLELIPKASHPSKCVEIPVYKFLRTTGAVENVESRKQAALMEQSTLLRGKLTVFSGRIE
jgi:hypothetical protein